MRYSICRNFDVVFAESSLGLQKLKWSVNGKGRQLQRSDVTIARAARNIPLALM